MAKGKLNSLLDLNIPGLKDSGFSAYADIFRGFDKREDVPFSWLKGKTLWGIYGLEGGSGVAIFNTTDGDSFILYHEQDCCETVLIDDVCGDVADLIGSEILGAEEVDNSIARLGAAIKSVFCESDMSETWTFYKIKTRKGYVDIRWYGTSNGYYSESVNTFLLTAADKAAIRKRQAQQTEAKLSNLQKEVDEEKKERVFWRDAYTDLKMRMEKYFDYYANYFDDIITLKGMPNEAVLKLNDTRRGIKESRAYLKEHINSFDKNEE